MAERPLTPSAFILLGLLTSRDWSAYELAEQVGRGVDQLWPRADRQRYNVLKRLHSDGLVSTRNEYVGSRARTIYSITPAGREALAEWMGTEVKPPALEFEGMVRVLMGEQATLDELRHILETTVEQAEAALDLFAGHAAAMTDAGGTFPERQHLLAMANRFMIGHYLHMVEWARWALAEIEDWPDTTSPAVDRQEQTLAMLEPGLRVLAERRAARDASPD
jgi:DNA-binding PadR family transcriptional regulator